MAHARFVIGLGHRALRTGQGILSQIARLIQSASRFPGNLNQTFRIGLSGFRFFLPDLTTIRVLFLALLHQDLLNGLLQSFRVGAEGGLPGENPALGTPLLTAQHKGSAVALPCGSFKVPKEETKTLDETGV